MRLSFTILFAMILEGSGLSGFGADVATDTQSIRTNFVAEAMLSPTELLTVVQLAKNCGVEQVAEVNTSKRNYPHCLVVSVKSAETVVGRRVSYVTVSMILQPWNMRIIEPGDRPVKSSGGFRFGASEVRTNRFTTFTVSDKKIRVRLKEGMLLSIADSIVEAFEKGSVLYIDDSLKEKLKEIDLSKPLELADFSDSTYSICFSCGPECLRDVHFGLKGDEVIVFYVGPKSIYGSAVPNIISTYP